MPTSGHPSVSLRHLPTLKMSKKGPHQTILPHRLSSFPAEGFWAASRVPTTPTRSTGWLRHLMSDSLATQRTFDWRPGRDTTKKKKTTA